MQRPSSRARRWMALALPPVLLVLLVILGRRAQSAAAAPASSTSSPVTSAHEGGVDETAPPPPDGGSGGPEASPPAIEALPDGAIVVDLNLASEEELRRLPGIGPGRAKKILELRARLGRIRSVDDLARIKGFGRTLIKRLRPLCKSSAKT
ncbi:MAG: helix-hairpin-helix domain-containing protein [Deltaproteobacteria bacterium]|nr:helix-hairpin-helix domain-containing protein [Deltaproteobacteria bacterium]